MHPTSNTPDPLSHRPQDPAPTFEVRAGGDDETFILALHGELDLAGEPRMRAACETAIRAGTSEIIVDLGALTYIDSVGLKCLLLLSRLAEGSRVSLRVMPGPAPVHRVFDISGLGHVFTFHERP